MHERRQLPGGRSTDPADFPPESNEHRAESTNQIQSDVISPGIHL